MDHVDAVGDLAEAIEQGSLQIENLVGGGKLAHDDEHCDARHDLGVDDGSDMEAVHQQQRDH